MAKSSFFNKIIGAAKNAIRTPEGRGDYDEEDDDVFDEYDEDEDDLYGKYAGEPSKPKTAPWQQPKPSYTAPAASAPTQQPTERYTQYAESRATGNVFQMKQQAAPAQPKFKFALVKIDRIENAVTAADHMLAGNTVTLLDMSTVPENAARRVIDFLDGVRYTCNARIELIADLTYVIVPDTVELSGDFLSQVDTNGFKF